MNILCNGEEREIAPGTSIGVLLKDLGLDPDSVVAECDSRILKREEYDTFVLDEGAALELIRFVGGG
ncbi:MAG: sulfur carrier protein ThiS [Desulfobulbaceae bacterium]|nr:sulfur carrier protein ThiS [Desulfobulbaceae bacterium]MCK5341604.1 sulfur carrier protein ThiS [Desulfobulbaceae bacterium]MCK5404536.1 sulfur carrier protein ThiS [Desulfobulbaceae bacterium]